MANCVVKTLSGFWPVPGNPKPSYQQGHLKMLKTDQVDLFLSEDNLPWKQLPSQRLLTRKHTETELYLKFGRPVTPEVVNRITPILTSKILLLKHLAEVYPDADYYQWIDCVNTENLDIISQTESDRIICNQYQGDRWQRQNQILYGNVKNPYDTWLLAQVVKVPRHRLEPLCDAYSDAIQWVNHRYPVTDAEFPLARVYDLYPDWFELI